MNKPPRNHKDRSAKAILTFLGKALARFMTGLDDVRVESVHIPELQILTMSPDLLLEVTHPDRGTFLMVLEIQVNPDPDLPYRFATLTAHLMQKHRVPVVPVVVYLFRGRGQRPDPLFTETLGLRFQADFHEIVIPDLEAVELLERGLDGPWWPFAVFARGGREVDVVRRLLEVQRTRPELAAIMPTVLNLTLHVVDSDQVRSILEGPMLESLFRKLEPLEGSFMWEVREAMKAEARAEGLAEGRAEGRAEGSTREALLLAKRLMARKFGLPDPDLTARLETLPLEVIENLAVALLDLGSLEDLSAWLDRATAETQTGEA